jgi:chromosome segregation ATPase/pSer/pThr/pTyr-binding forkhead associated (FHA) protein
MATLVYSDSDGRDRSYALGAEPVTVGRAPECTIRSEDPRVSRMHARFFVDQGGLWIEDLGSTHGIYVGPNKVQRAPVPPGEVVLIGSLLIRLVPANGTMPPPIGLHGTLATWLDLERKNRVTVEEERDAFAKRVGELHEEIARTAAGATLRPGDEPSTTDTSTDMAGAGDMAEAVRLRDEAEAKSAAVERALAAVQDELMVLRETSTGDTDEDVRRLRAELAMVRDRLIEAERDLADRAEWSTLVGAEHRQLSTDLESAKLELDEATAARSVAEHAAGEAARESQILNKQIDELRRASAADLEIARMEAAKMRDGKNVADLTAGVAAAEKLAEMDLEIESLKRQLTAALTAPAATPVDSEAKVQELTEQLAQLTGRSERVEKELASAQIRAQGAERNLSHATSQTAKAETRIAQLEEKATDAETRVDKARDELARAKEQVAALEARVGSGDGPVVAAEARAAKMAADLRDVQAQLEKSKARVTELESAVTAAEQAKQEAEKRSETIKTELAQAQAKLGDVEKKLATVQSKVDELSKAEIVIAAATKSRDDAAARAMAADQTVSEANRRADDAEQRANAADTMAKAMAKDVDEALRRAADADTKTRSGSRELADLQRRVAAAEAANANTDETVKAADARAADADERAEAVRKDLVEQLEITQQELTAKIAATQQELGDKVAAAQRELAAERKTALGLIERKTQLERELAEARAALPEAVKRAEAAEARIAEAEVQLEQLQDRIDDLESSLAVTETASQATAGESAEKITGLEKQLAEAKELRAKVGDLEAKLATLTQERDELTQLLTSAEARAASTDDDRDKLADALRRASDAERKSDALHATAETADLAIGRAGALQRQLDEALSKLAFLERDSSRPRKIETPTISEQVMHDRIAAAEDKVKEIESQLGDAERRAQTSRDEADAARDEAGRAAAEIATAQQHVQAQLQAAQHVQQQHVELQTQFVELQTRTTDAEAMVQESERRAGEAELLVAELQARVTELGKRPANQNGNEQQLFDAQRKIAELEREVANADNVRSFAAETEREIAQLQRDLRDAKTKVTQLSLERDRMESELRNLRDDSETTNRRVPVDPKQAKKVDYDPEATSQADVSKYEPIIAKANELEKRAADLQLKIVDLEKTNAQLRAQLADSEERLREAIDRDDDDGAEHTHTGSQLPIAFAEHLSVLEESIDSLRANMRAASDETAMMDQSDSVIAVSSAVSQAAEHIERARAAIRSMNASIGPIS